VGLLIDTSVLVDAEHGRLDLDALIAAHGTEDAAISAITAAELLHGVNRLTGARRARAALFVEPLFELLPVLPFDLDAARVQAALSADLRARGSAVGAHDLLIAATAIAHDCAVLTRDLRSYPKVSGLDVIRL
jgi:predicted nucleic acid-binding protein